MDGTRGAAVSRLGFCRTTGGVIYYRKVVLHPDQAGCCIRCTSTASIAGNLAVFTGLISGKCSFALHQEMVACRQAFEKIAGAGFDTVAASGAFFRIHHRYAVIVHVDCVEGTGDLAIGQAQAAPGATFSSCGNQRCTTTAIESLVFGDLIGLCFATGAVQPGRPFFLLARIDT